jgi:hypothetical protein
MLTKMIVNLTTKVSNATRIDCAVLSGLLSHFVQMLSRFVQLSYNNKITSLKSDILSVLVISPVCRRS